MSEARKALRINIAMSCWAMTVYRGAGRRRACKPSGRGRGYRGASTQVPAARISGKRTLVVRAKLVIRAKLVVRAQLLRLQIGLSTTIWILQKKTRDASKQHSRPVLFEGSRGVFLKGRGSCVQGSREFCFKRRVFFV